MSEQTGKTGNENQFRHTAEMVQHWPAQDWALVCAARRRDATVIAERFRTIAKLSAVMGINAGIVSEHDLFQAAGLLMLYVESLSPETIQPSAEGKG